MARSVEPSDENDPANETVEIDTADEPQFADGFEVFDPDDEQPELADGDGDVVVAIDDAELEDADPTLAIDARLVVDDSQFDSDDAISEAALDPDAEDDDEVEGVRGTEFVCLGCYLAKRRTQLADKKRSLCIDCV
ncbi:MAG: hypothetical protein WD360_00660 [Nitriliruptoraceae bacterium]